MIQSADSTKSFYPSNNSKACSRQFSPENRPAKHARASVYCTPSFPYEAALDLVIVSNSVKYGLFNTNHIASKTSKLIQLEAGVLGLR